ncbi:hypothetical protein B0T17DRAFT_487167 [Bombardia bombarda]|uniref:Pentatricopeptide repeat protein n=1 Tax=Bombardia bombarda TaxID=252184 RepID=A0AA40C7V1_9PEZI|nr:hypothetical protein B0T17DRAFT_487167 [Bombardia bombarda]
MPPRPFAADLSRTTSYICQSCLSGLRGHSTTITTTTTTATSAAANPQPWLLAAARSYSSRSNASRSLLSPPDGAEQPLNVRYFNEEQPGEYRQLPNGVEFGKASGGLHTNIVTAIDDLEQQMANTVNMLQRMEKQEGMQDKADELRRQFKKTLRIQYKGKTGPEAEQYGLLKIAGFGGGPRQRPIANLNKFLARESVVRGGIPKQKDLVECWKFYSAARKTLATSWASVPREVWDFLWMVLSWEGSGVENVNRMRHIYVLTKDMQAAGLTLRDSQQLLAIEAMFIEGWQDEAIEAWKKAVVTLGSKPETFKNYWELGVRMCCLRGDVDRAQRAADTLLKSSASADEPPAARILFPIIRALAVKEATTEQAWAAYQQLRELLGDDMKIEDYDEVITSFLVGNCVEHGLQAFVDMMFSDAIDIRGRTKLPTVVSNHFFTGKWLKRLIGAGDLDGAYKVVVYLQRKGVASSPIQLNGLIGAWIRSETAENLDKAENLAWSMIRARVEYVQMRKRTAEMHVPIRFYDPSPQIQPSPVATTGEEGEQPGIVETEDFTPPTHFRSATRASSETFSLLAENYAARGMHDRLQDLWAVLEQAEIGTSSFMMNQLIRSYAQNSQPDEALGLYERLVTRDRRVRPDAHTYLALFNSLSVNRLIVRDKDLSVIDAKNSRRFFAEMVRASWVFDSLDTYNILPRTVLFSMLKAKDYIAMIVAARAMRYLFDFSPSEALLIELASGTATLRVQSKRNMEKIMEGTKTIRGLMAEHRRGLVERGEVDAGEGGAIRLNEEQKATELGAVLEKLIMVKAGAQEVEFRRVQPILEETAREMGVFEVVVRRDEEWIERCKKVVRREVD